MSSKRIRLGRASSSRTASGDDRSASIEQEERTRAVEPLIPIEAQDTTQEIPIGEPRSPCATRHEASSMSDEEALERMENGEPLGLKKKVVKKRFINPKKKADPSTPVHPSIRNSETTIDSGSEGDLSYTCEITTSSRKEDLAKVKSFTSENRSDMTDAAQLFACKYGQSFACDANDGGSHFAMPCPTRQDAELNSECQAVVYCSRNAQKTWTFSPESEWNHVNCPGSRHMLSARQLLKVPAFIQCCVGFQKPKPKGILAAIRHSNYDAFDYTIARAVKDFNAQSTVSKLKGLRFLPAWCTEFSSYDGNGYANFIMNEDKLKAAGFVLSAGYHICRDAGMPVSMVDMSFSKDDDECPFHHMAIVGQDCDNKLTLLGWGLVEGEDTESYLTIMKLFYEWRDEEGPILKRFLDDENHTQFSDRHKAILAMQRVMMPKALSRHSIDAEKRPSSVLKKGTFSSSMVRNFMMPNSSTSPASPCLPASANTPL